MCMFYVSFIYRAYLCWAFVQCMCFECEYAISVCGLRDSILVLVLVVWSLSDLRFNSWGMEHETKEKLFVSIQMSNKMSYSNSKQKLPHSFGLDVKFRRIKI
jgi:hypothetical protein